MRRFDADAQARGQLCADIDLDLLMLMLVRARELIEDPALQRIQPAFPQLVESRYDLAFRYLASHCRKRSLVVLVTNVIDEVNANQIERYLTNLVGRHLPLAVLLRDRSLFQAVEVEHPHEEQLWRAAAAAEILTWRRQVLSDLHNKGALVLDVFPEAMTAPLVNRYLEIKARHLL